jgi:hypothetical protein
MNAPLEIQLLTNDVRYREALRQGANTGAGFTVSPDRWTVVRFVRVMALPLMVLALLMVWRAFQ